MDIQPAPELWPDWPSHATSWRNTIRSRGTNEQNWFFKLFAYIFTSHIASQLDASVRFELESSLKQKSTALTTRLWRWNALQAIVAAPPYSATHPITFNTLSFQVKLNIVEAKNNFNEEIKKCALNFEDFCDRQHVRFKIFSLFLMLLQPQVYIGTFLYYAEVHSYTT